MAQDPTTGTEQRRSFMQQFGRLSHIAFVVPAGIMAGWFIGSELDKYFHTDWIYILGLLLGMIAGFVDLFRTVVSTSK